MSAYYNEIDPYAAQWLRNLIAAGHIAPGEVDTRSIEDVHPRDLDDFTQCHFFAGIGVWSYALRRAGWPDHRPVWTGSCPCQPFSAAGKGVGFADERHLWPSFFHLICEHRPSVIFGEQVASKDADPWIDLVHADVETLDYAIGCVPFAAAGIGAPHIRERIYWVAHADHARLEGRRQPGGRRSSECAVGQSGMAGGLADTDGRHPGAERQQPGGEYGQQPEDSGIVRDDCGANPLHGFWRDSDWLACRDGRWRPVEPGTFPLAHGAPARVGRLRAYGNAIVAPQAEEFIRAVMEVA